MSFVTFPIGCRTKHWRGRLKWAVRLAAVDNAVTPEEHVTNGLTGAVITVPAYHTYVFANRAQRRSAACATRKRGRK